MSDIDVIMAKLNEIDAKLSSMPPGTAAPPAEIINSEELCRRLDISEPTLVSWRRKKKIPFIKIDGVIRYNWPAVISQLETKKS